MENFITFKDRYWEDPVVNDHKANWRSFKGKSSARGIEWYEYSSEYTIGSRRIAANEAFNIGAKCYPTPDGTYSLPNEWKTRSCGISKELCVHRTFHEVIPFKPNCTVAKKHFLSNAVKEECYDYIYRMEDVFCTDGYLPGGCHKEYCSREGQSNCWCGDEEDFCTMGCVKGVCQEICGDRVCEPYELCYGEFNAIRSFAKCVTECTAPKSNYCLWENDEGNTVYCRHFNMNYNSAIMQQLDPPPQTPCFDEVPNIPESQCQDVFSKECFCGRDFVDGTTEMVCFDTADGRKLRPLCDILQDDGTCTYETSDDGTCMCGESLLDMSQSSISESKCYAVDNQCGLKATATPNCTDILGTGLEVEKPQGCMPSGSELDINFCISSGSIVKEYTAIDSEPSIKCIGSEEIQISGCKDPKGKNYNTYAEIPKKCYY